MGPEPELYSVALCTAIGDNLTAIVACYLKAAVTNPTSDPLLLSLRGDQSFDWLLTSAGFTLFWVIQVACDFSGLKLLLKFLLPVLV